MVHVDLQRTVPSRRPERKPPKARSSAEQTDTQPTLKETARPSGIAGA